MKRAEKAARSILDDIADGEFAMGDELPSEAQLAERYSMSRLSIREAVSSLSAKGVLEVRHGKLNRVAPMKSWSALDPDIMSLRGRMSGDSQLLIMELMEARTVLEVSFAGMAAERIEPEQLDRLARHLEAMTASQHEESSMRSAEADLGFHRAIVEAAGNEFLAGAYASLENVLMAVRLKTSSTQAVRRDAIHWHARILEALREGDAEKARSEMAGHMEQTLQAVSELEPGD